MPKSPLEVPCPVCRSRVGSACTGFILGGGEFHHARNARAANWDRSVETLRTRRKTSLSGRRRVVVEPIDGSWALAATCYSCHAKPGVECSVKSGNERFHKQRRDRGEVLREAAGG
ncbi:zinc finger domain-containing protein [Nocardiopsis alba]